ncbi:hypothetical protein BD769DRAFT_1390637 [Suillus cothurnatus]|nr:hypothetical protein BD769DRAFT_1390637 [Suillus cothurnatus]
MRTYRRTLEEDFKDKHANLSKNAGKNFKDKHANLPKNAGGGISKTSMQTYRRTLEEEFQRQACEPTEERWRRNFKDKHADLSKELVEEEFQDKHVNLPKNAGGGISKTSMQTYRRTLEEEFQRQACKPVEERWSTVYWTVEPEGARCARSSLAWKVAREVHMAVVVNEGGGGGEEGIRDLEELAPKSTDVVGHHIAQDTLAAPWKVDRVREMIAASIPLGVTAKELCEWGALYGVMGDEKAWVLGDENSKTRLPV